MTGRIFARKLRIPKIDAVRLGPYPPGVIRNAPTDSGWLEVVCGPMFSGKSEELMRRLRRAEIAGQRVLIVKPGIDNRYDISDVVSHSGMRMPAVGMTGAADIVQYAEGYAVVGIDEAQFFDDEIVDVCLGLADRGVRVIAAGLDTDFRVDPFGPMPVLLARAEFVDKLQAVCHRCGGPATRTQRLVNGEPAPFGGQTIQVGALDAYEARCRTCYEPGRDHDVLVGQSNTSRRSEL